MVGVAIKESKISPLYSFFKMGEKIVIAHDIILHHKYIINIIISLLEVYYSYLNLFKIYRGGEGLNVHPVYINLLLNYN